MPLVPPRAAEPEWMERPDVALADLGSALRDLRWTNRWLGGLRAIRELVRPHLLAADPGHPVEILDVGTGGADLPLALVDLARELGRPLALTAIDVDARTTALARAATRGCPEIRFVCADARHLPFGGGAFDLVLASLFLHHFSASEVVTLLRDFRRVSRRAVLVNDLRRHVLPWAFIAVAARLTARHPIFVHDAPLSVRRGFTAAELACAARAAGVPDARPRESWPYRLLLELPAGSS